MSGHPPFGGRQPSVSTERFAPRGVIVRVTGDLDLALAPRLKGAIDREIAAGHRHFAIDLAGTTFLDCASLGTLVRALAPLRDEPDASVVLGGATGPVARILSVLGLEAVFEIVADVGQVAGDGGPPGRRGVEGWRRAAARPRRAIPLSPQDGRVARPSAGPEHQPGRDAAPEREAGHHEDEMSVS